LYLLNRTLFVDIDLPFYLFWAVVFCGVIWLVDTLFFRATRIAANPDDDPETHEPLIVEYARSFFPVLLLVLVLRGFVAEPYQIPSESMVPTLEVGDFILVNKYAYGLRLPVFGTKVVSMDEPQRGEVMGLPSFFFPPVLSTKRSTHSWLRARLGGQRPPGAQAAICSNPEHRR
jgi:signal peptidase I